MNLLAQPWMALRRLHWMRGVRAGLAVLVAMVVCRALDQPMGWAALGGFEAVLVDNGGPYRSRLMTMLTVLVGGAIACIAGALAYQPLWLAVVVTALFCFALTYARVLSNPLASTSVVILVLYFAGFGGSEHTLSGVLVNAGAYLLGGLWAALLSLFLWPLDPFRPARFAVAECYTRLADFTTSVRATQPGSAERQAERTRMHNLQRQMRTSMEAARTAIAATGARITSRTIRARSLTVLLETADILFAGTIRWTELCESAEDQASREAIVETLMWLARAERVINDALVQHPADEGASFSPEGSHAIEYLQKRRAALHARNYAPGSLLAHMVQDERDALLNVEVAFEALRALWSGVEYRTPPNGASRAEQRSAVVGQTGIQLPVAGWRAMVDAARANWTPRSMMMRHALRILVVGAADVLLMRMVHIVHGTWLGMTSIIVLQPTGIGTLRRGAQRVGGTIAGGVLAAIFASTVHNQTGLIAVVTMTSLLTLATYAVDYGWYSFFLTPTFVLLAMPHLRDWSVAGVRIGMTVLGAVVAVLAMRLLWPEKGQMERLLARGAEADAAYVGALVRYWKEIDAKRSAESRLQADRTVLAPARRECGLAINDAEEMLDRLMLEPRLGQGQRWEEALSFATYLRRLTRAVTALASVGTCNPLTVERVEAVRERLEAVSVALLHGTKLGQVQDDPAVPLVDDANDLAEYQLRRMERQAGVLERTAALLIGR